MDNDHQTGSPSNEAKNLIELKEQLVEKIKTGFIYYTMNKEGSEEILYEDGTFKLKYDGDSGTGFIEITKENMFSKLLEIARFRTGKQNQVELMEYILSAILKR